MTTLRKLLGAGAFGALVAATTSCQFTTTSAAPRFDGLWSVSIVTEKGDCDRGYRYPIRISNGQLVNAGDTNFAISGKVGQTGAITVTVAAAGKSATGSGQSGRRCRRRPLDRRRLLGLLDRRETRRVSEVTYHQAALSLKTAKWPGSSRPFCFAMTYLSACRTRRRDDAWTKARP